MLSLSTLPVSCELTCFSSDWQKHIHMYHAWVRRPAVKERIPPACLCSEMYIPELSFIKPRHERRRRAQTRPGPAARFNKRTFGCWQEAISEALLGGSRALPPAPLKKTLNFKPVLLQKARPTTTSAGVIWHWHEQLHFAATSTPSAAARDDSIIRRAEQEDTLEKQAAGDHAISNFTHSRKDCSCSFTQPFLPWAPLISGPCPPLKTCRDTWH